MYLLSGFTEQNHKMSFSVQHLLADDAPTTISLIKASETLLLYGAFFKHPSFKKEKEWRLVCALPTDLRFRKGKSMIIPYTLLDISTGENLCIRHAFVGPCPHKELSKQSLEWLLATNNILTTVNSSSIPLRDWEPRAPPLILDSLNDGVEFGEFFGFLICNVDRLPRLPVSGVSLCKELVRPSAHEMSDLFVVPISLLGDLIPPALSPSAHRGSRCRGKSPERFPFHPYQCKTCNAQRINNTDF